jgi:hypothetical protein
MRVAAVFIALRNSVTNTGRVNTKAMANILNGPFGVSDSFGAS